MTRRLNTKSSTAEHRIDRDLTAWSFMAALLLFAALAGPFFVGRVYTGDDLGEFHLPIRAFYAEQLSQGEAHDWMPGLYTGFYLTGEGQGGVYHPLHQFLYRCFSLRAAFGLECLFSYPLMFFGTWFFLKRQIGRKGAAAFGALLFTFSSFNFLHFVHPNGVAVIAHIPWLLWAINIVLLDTRRRKVAMATAMIALLTASQILLGYPQFVWLSLITELAYTIFLLTAYKYTGRAGGDACHSCNDCVGCTTQTWPRLVIAKGVGLMLGGVQLLPTLDAWLNSSRLAADAGFSAWGSLHPMNLLQLVAPYLFTNRVIGDSTHEYGLYIGAAPFLLVVWMIARRRELGSLSFLAWAAFGFAITTLFLAFGCFGPLYPAISWLPLLGTFRFPCRYIVLFQLAMAIMATIGFVLLVNESRLARKNRVVNQPRRKRWPWRGLWHDFEPLWCVIGFSAALAAIGIMFHFQPSIGSVPAILAGPLLIAGAVVLVVFAVRGHTAAIVGLIIFAAADLGYYGLSYSVYPRNNVLEQYAASASTPPGDTDGRVVGDLMRYDERGIRTGNSMVLQGWSRADGYSGLAPDRRLDYQLLPALRVAGVRWVKKVPSTASIEGLEPYNDSWMKVPDPLDRVRLVSRAKTSNNPAKDISLIDPDTTALVEKPVDLPSSEPGRTVLTAESPGRLEIDVECPAAQLLVVAESHHLGWRATIDGRSSEVYRVNGDFIGCLTTSGKHHIVFEFHPKSLHRGWAVSWIGLCLLSLCFLGFTARPESGPPEDCRT